MLRFVFKSPISYVLLEHFLSPPLAVLFNSTCTTNAWDLPEVVPIETADRGQSTTLVRNCSELFLRKHCRTAILARKACCQLYSLIFVLVQVATWNYRYSCADHSDASLLSWVAAGPVSKQSHPSMDTASHLAAISCSGEQQSFFIRWNV